MNEDKKIELKIKVQIYILNKIGNKKKKKKNLHLTMLLRNKV